MIRVLLFVLLRVCPVKSKFGGLNSVHSLNKLENYLLSRSYLVDALPTQMDVITFALLEKAGVSIVASFTNIKRYYSHIASFRNEFEFLPCAELP